MTTPPSPPTPDGIRPAFTVLVVEDDPHSRALLVHFLTSRGYIVLEAALGSEGLDAAHRAQVVLLDVGLPDIDGWHVAETLRRDLPDLPVIFVTGSGDVADKLLGFDLGAEDYLVKPYDLNELEARLRTELRRSRPRALLEFYDLVVDLEARSATLSGERLALTPLEFDLLALLATHPMRIWSREELLRRVWGHGSDVIERTVDVRVRHLRSALDDDAHAPRFIETVRGRGYRWLPESA